MDTAYNDTNIIINICTLVHVSIISIYDVIGWEIFLNLI